MEVRIEDSWKAVLKEEFDLPYFSELSESLANGENPRFVLIDCLNCQKGCNCGAGTVNQNVPLDKLEGYIEDRMENRKNLLKTVSFSFYVIFLSGYL